MGYQMKITFVLIVTISCLLNTSDARRARDDDDDRYEELECYSCNSAPHQGCNDEKLNVTGMRKEKCMLPSGEFRETHVAACQKAETYTYYIESGTGKQLRRYNTIRGCFNVAEDKVNTCEHYNSAQGGGSICYCDETHRCNSASSITFSISAAFVTTIRVIYTMYL